MDKLNISGLKRNSDIIKSYFKKVGETTVVKANVKILFPARYINRGLAIIGSNVKLLSIFAIVDEKNNYAVVRAPIMQEVSPYVIGEVSLDDVVYKELSFRANDVFITNNNLVKTDNFMYEVFDEFFVKGNIPWFMDYDDVANVMLETGKYADSKIGDNPLTMEILASVIARNPNDKRVFFRKKLTPENKNKLKPVYVGLNNIYYSFESTGAKLIGGYFGYGVTAAIVDKEEETSDVAKVLRS
jgi:hypothetical protein